MNKPDLFLITIDCLRPDYVGAFNRVCNLTPHLDRLLQQGTIFTQTVSHAPFTTPSIASLMTGRYPIDTGVRLLLGQLCDSKLPTIAESAQMAGYQTAGFPSAFILNSETGLNRGYDYYRDVVDGVMSGRGGCWQDHRPIHDALDVFLLKAAKSPVFCWIHYFDLHDYHVDESRPHHASYSRDVFEKIDRDCIGGLMGIIERRRNLENAAFVVTADHGECLYQHGQRGHGWHVYDSVMRVPLGIVWPGQTTPGSVRTDLARHVDILPTLDALWNDEGTSKDSRAPGRNLLSHEQHETISYAEASPRQLFQGDATANKSFAGPEIQSIRTNRHKYIRNDDGRVELYDLLLDPNEVHDIHEKDKRQTEKLSKILDCLLSGANSTRHASRPIADDAENDAVRERLRALGYVH